MTLQLFASKSHVTGGQHNTSFSCEPTEITEANAEAFFRRDHTTIQFEGGYGKGDNFVHATAIPFDIDNSHSDNPDDWVQPDDIANRLMEMGINFVIVAKDCLGFACCETCTKIPDNSSDSNDTSPTQSS